jgi:dTDP-4-dehydrorhamnose 3,5-epimerase
MIEGVQITKLNKIDDDRGSILTMLRSDSKVFESFGEIYFSTIFNKAIKAWHLHQKAILNYACIKGKVKLVLYDDRERSKTYKNHQELILSPDDYFMVTIPPLIWNGFQGIDINESIIANCMSLPHDEKEMVRKDPTDKYFAYNWNFEG